MKPFTIDPSKITVLHGKEQYNVDLPDGDCQVDYSVCADGVVAAYVAAGSEVIPVAVGHLLRGRIRVRACCGFVVRADKSTVVGLEVYHSPITIDEKLDLTPVAIAEPNQSIPLHMLIARGVREELSRRGGDDVEVDLEELDYPEDVDEDFGFGHMEPDEEMISKARGRLKRGNKQKDAKSSTDSDPPKPQAPPEEETKEGER